MQRKNTPRKDLSLCGFMIHKKSIPPEVKLHRTMIQRGRSAAFVKTLLFVAIVRIATTTDGLLRILLAYFSLCFRDVAYASTMARPLSRGRSYQSLGSVRVFSKVYSSQAIIPFFFVFYFDNIGAFLFFLEVDQSLLQWWLWNVNYLIKEDFNIWLELLFIVILYNGYKKYSHNPFIEIRSEEKALYARSTSLNNRDSLCIIILKTCCLSRQMRTNVRNNKSLSIVSFNALALMFQCITRVCYSKYIKFRVI